MSKHASKARGERKRKDVGKQVGRTAKGVKNLALGVGGTGSLAAVAIYTAAQTPQGQAYMRKGATIAARYATVGLKAVRNEINIQRTKQSLKKFM